MSIKREEIIISTEGGLLYFPFLTKKATSVLKSCFQTFVLICTFLFQGSEMNLFATERTFLFQSPLDLLLMLLWASLLVIASVCGQSATPKPVIFLTPPWTTYFKGETVLLKCNGFHSYVTGKTQWYFNQKLLEETHSSISVQNSGQYQCRIQDSPLSNSVSLSFTRDELILQTQYPVFEGDTLVLRCRRKRETELTDVVYYKNGKTLKIFKNGSFKDTNFSIPKARLSNNDQYHCTAKKILIWKMTSKIEAKPVAIQVQELFSFPILNSTTFEPIEGTTVTLSCETELSPEKANTQLYFSFFKNSIINLSGWKGTSKFQLTNIWKEDSGLYHCAAKTMTSEVWKKSFSVRIKVKRIPVSGIHMEIQPPGGQVTEGQTLVLLCSVAGGTGDITFSWYKEGTGTVLKKKTERFLEAEFKILAVRESEAGKYYCTADNTNSSLYSRLVSISIKIPVSPPLLTFSIPKAQMFVGKIVELRCDVQRGSAPILYRFYHEGKIMKNSSASFGDAASFNLSLTKQHSGNYFCEADNGISVQSSQVLMLSVKVPVSRPLLTISEIKSQVPGQHLVELHCEAETGTSPILYKFFHQGIILGSVWTYLGEAAFLNLSLKAEDSGIYSCEADNGISPQLSEGVEFSVTGKQRGLFARGVNLGLLGFLGLIGVALLLYFRSQRRSGENFTPGLSRDLANLGFQNPTEVELEPTYVNAPADTDQQSRAHNPVFADQELAVNPVISDIVYSEVWNSQQKKEDADGFRSMLSPTQDFSVVYSEVKAEQPLQERSGMTEATEETREDDIGNYENVHLHS
ncbi:Fc receptor-like protein 3 isoform X2 [Sarcophilus harrisii]|uniref:Fc receptor-like protein 3 isoform X2 n=1 Tax=Sarcophilus harrisii TaxID=9305 RepID=UPI0013020894|nr:Fc receptor-like protein 3 isoform X2 [Sarcophilus harrisii]